MKLINYDASRYFADDVGCNGPTLNSSIAKMLVDPSCTPAHARLAHPKLAPKVAAEDEEADDGKEATHFTIGKAVHRLVLGRGAEIEVVDYKDWRTAAARSARAAIASEGRTPLLSKDHAKVVPLVDSVRSFMAREGLPPIEEWETEVVYTGRTRHGDETRGMIDARHPVDRTRLDLKTAADMSLRAITNAVFDGGYSFQDRFYNRLLEYNSEPPGWSLIIFIDKSPAMEHRIVKVDSFGEDIADRQIDRAEDIWHQCLTTGQWPGWPSGVLTVTPPDWYVKAQGEYF